MPIGKENPASIFPTPPPTPPPLQVKGRGIEGNNFNLTIAGENEYASRSRFNGIFNFLLDDEYHEERERSDSRYFRKRKTKIYQKELAGKELRKAISHISQNLF